MKILPEGIFKGVLIHEGNPVKTKSGFIKCDITTGDCYNVYGIIAGKLVKTKKGLTLSLIPRQLQETK